MSDVPAIVSKQPMSMGTKLAIGGLSTIVIGSLIAVVISMIMVANKSPDLINSSAGGNLPSTGGSSSSTGGSLPSTGGSSSSTGGSSSSTGGSLPSTGGSSPSTGGISNNATANNRTMFIRLRKELANVPTMLSAYPNHYNDWGFAVSELKVYADGKLLPKNAFSGVAYTRGKQYGPSNPGSNMIDGDRTTTTNAVAIMSFGEETPVKERGSTEVTATLFTPENITSIEVYNVLGNMGGRPYTLAGTQVILEDAYGNTIWESPILTSDDVQVLTPQYKVSGFQGFATSMGSIGQRINAIARRLMR